MKTLRALIVLFALAAPVALASWARADGPPPPKTDSEGFVPVAPNEQLAPGESIPGNRLVGVAYGVILGAMVVWIASVAVRARRVEDELAQLRARIEAAGKG
jgi:hypothetical protein